MKEITLQLPDDLHEQVNVVLEKRGVSLEDFVRLALRGTLSGESYVPLKSIMPFGKYKGEPLETVIRANPRYVQWLLRESKTFSMDEAAHQLLDMVIDVPQNERGVKLKKGGRPRQEQQQTQVQSQELYEPLGSERELNHDVPFSHN